MTAEEFVCRFVDSLRQRAADLRSYGAPGPAQTCVRIATELEREFRQWWLTELSITEAAGESGYSEEQLRHMARTGKLPAKKGTGERGHVRIARCHLPRRPKPEPDDGIASLEARLLGPRQSDLRKRA
jgi:hypothetical protein